jgi:hypothetical protein
MVGGLSAHSVDATMIWKPPRRLGNGHQLKLTGTYKTRGAKYPPPVGVRHSDQ